MIFWIGNIVLFIIYNFFLSISQLKKEQKNSFLLLIMFLQLLFMYTFGSQNIFPDTLPYLQGFEYSSKIGWLDIPNITYGDANLKAEIGWWYYNKILSSIYNNSTYLLFASGFIYLLAYFKLIKKHSLVTWLSIFLFIMTVFYTSFFLLRQTLAVSICLFSLRYIVERKFLKFFLLIGIAFCFHQTSLIFITLYFLYPLKLNNKSFFIYIGLALILSLAFRQMVNIATSNLIFYATYGSDDSYHLVQNNTSLYISLSVFIFINFCYYPFKKINNYEKIFLFMLLLFLFVEFSRVGLAGTIGRLNLYFIASIIILLPNAIKRVKKPMIRYIYMTTISILYLILMMQQMYYGFDLIF